MASCTDHMSVPERAALASLDEAHAHVTRPSPSIQIQFSDGFFVQVDCETIEQQLLTTRAPPAAASRRMPDEADSVEPQRQNPTDLLATRASEEMHDGAEAAAGVDAVGDVEGRSIHRVLLRSDGHGGAVEAVTAKAVSVTECVTVGVRKGADLEGARRGSEMRIWRGCWKNYLLRIPVMPSTS